MKIVAILQARMGSTRLPGKIMLPLAGRPMLEQLYRRVTRATTLDQVIIAMPTGSWNAIRDAYMPFEAVSLHEGEEDDLVARYLACATRHQADVIVRIPCDNPCVDPAYLDAAVRAYLRDPCVYYSNTTAYVGDVAVDGIGAEVLSMSRLQWLDQRTQGHALWREHPHRYFEECGLLQVPKADLRLDVNTLEDYERIARLYTHFGHNRFTSTESVTYYQEVSHAPVQVQ